MGFTLGYIGISSIYIHFYHISWPQDIQIVSNYAIWVDLMTSQREKKWLGLLGIIAKLVKRSHPDVMIMNPESLSKN